jgi:hypothetical protein
MPDEDIASLVYPHIGIRRIQAKGARLFYLRQQPEEERFHARFGIKGGSVRNLGIAAHLALIRELQGVHV